MAYFHLFQDAAGHWRWRLTAANGQTVATSGESFYSRYDAQRAAERVRELASSAVIR